MVRVEGCVARSRKERKRWKGGGVGGRGRGSFSGLTTVLVVLKFKEEFGRGDRSYGKDGGRNRRSYVD